MRRAASTTLATLLAFALSLSAPTPIGAADLAAPTEARGSEAAFDYHLSPREIAPGVFVFIGRNEDFTVENGGNILNTGFIVGPEGVVVIDTGSSRRYGEQMLAAIRRVTTKPVVLALNTHHHPDHFLGNQAFPAETLAALPQTRQGIETDGEAFNENLYRMAGDWMQGTERVVPTRKLEPGRRLVAGRDLEFLALAGHTAGDLVVIDHATGTIFAGDLLFNGRTPTTPHADIPTWLAALDRLETLPAQRWVPGHGAIASDTSAIRQTRAWLQWLARTMRDGAEAGLDMTEMLAQPIAPEFRTLALVQTEYRRSVIHLFPHAEQAALSAPGLR
ncbi:MAG TPA: quinoprotein relay system zinc metallohydrolase 1 [Aromatoleum sp.]|uniref:quinoprotein relay system zinc metallohydrolase 1 n=1 Tax=Aromatoleum sp. TaxID=2307007 RepID=UPI002B48B662|nr:quinoprotein relay system zinc metallohydrolase 1 [Aromatoleum sp.]HJV27370.1 quinoprotein relay system zinc metallohydrolase 1 [Aromatoleum sp.]